MGGDKNSTESVSYDFPAETEQRMLHSSTSSEILLIKNVFFFDFLPEKWRIAHENLVSARIYHEVLKNLAENIGNFRRKASMF